jgi:small ligand-binding sensory domain FIST
VVSELLGDADITPAEYGFFVTLGRNMGDKWADFDETAYVNRMCLKANEKNNSLIMFEPDLEQGVEVQLMHRTVNIDYVAPRIDAVMNTLGDRKPVMAFYINCAGRAAAYSGLDGEDGHEVQRILADKVPLLGFYSGVEIAPVRGRPEPLDWTGVFCLLSVAS